MSELRGIPPGGLSKGTEPLHRDQLPRVPAGALYHHTSGDFSTLTPLEDTPHVRQDGILCLWCEGFRLGTPGRFEVPVDRLRLVSPD